MASDKLTSGRYSKVAESFEIPNSNFNKFISEPDLLKADVNK
jgi:hypothetical protein